MGAFIHPQGICESSNVGENTRIWAFAHVLPGARIGADCNICDHVFVENEVVIGDRVTIKCGVQLWDGVELEDDVFVGPNATFTNDPFPRSKRYRSEPLKTVVRQGASIGANATILPGITVGAGAMVGAGAVVTHSVPTNAIVHGNPARIHGYVDTVKAASHYATAGELNTSVQTTGVCGVTVHHLPFVEDMRGNLSAGEFERSVPFPVKRYFIVVDVPSVKVRGEHAHRRCHEFLVCVRGSVCVVADDGKNREEFCLDEPNIGIYLPPMTWTVQYRYSRDALLLAFCSDYYEAADYIRDYSEFLTELRR